jgi:hypothetical protein
MHASAMTKQKVESVDSSKNLKHHCPSALANCGHAPGTRQVNRAPWVRPTKQAIGKCLGIILRLLSSLEEAITGNAAWEHRFFKATSACLSALHSAKRIA